MYNKLLDTFIQVADSGSFSKASEKLFISPTAVMKQINALESELGFHLFDRSFRGLRLNETGQIFYTDSKKIIQISNESLNRARKTVSSKKHLIRIGTSLLNPCKSIMDLWATINKNPSLPSFELEIVSFEDRKDSYQSMMTSLGKNVDIIAGLYGYKWSETLFSTLELYRLPLCIAMSVNHPLSSKKILSIDDLYDQTLMMMNKGESDYIDPLRLELETNHPQIHISNIHHYDIEVFNRCEQQKTLLLSSSNWQDIHPLIVTIPVKWEFNVPFGLIYSNHPSVDVQLFIETARTLN
jgi:DNA-binding transcriptional LysR family regulator